MRVLFHARYDHRWPSRAMTHFPEGWEGTVKREVGERAVAKGKATLIRDRATPVSDAAAEAPEMAGSGGMALEDHRDRAQGLAPGPDGEDRGHGNGGGGPEAGVLGDLGASE